jgi:cytidine deaminase
MTSKSENLTITFQSYQSSQDLSTSDKELLEKARKSVSDAYAPYSHFYVGAAALLSTKQILTGTNQENASFPAGLCAERVLLSAISSIAPQTAIETMAISYKSDHLPSNRPIAPCGVCRQAMIEYEARFNKTMRIILAGQEGSVYVFESISDLLPLSFTPQDLGK